MHRDSRQAVIFDMDGVLVNTEPLYGETYAEIYRSYGLVLEPEERNLFVGTSTSIIWNFFKTKYNIQESAAELNARKNKIYSQKLHSLRELKPIDGVTELLAQLRKDGFVLAIASSSRREVIDYILGRAGIASFFSFISSGDIVTKGKPDPEIFLKAAELAGVAPSRCIVIEDADSGVQGAKDAGMTVYAYRNPHSGTQELSRADLVFSSYDELREIFLQRPESWSV